MKKVFAILGILALGLYFYPTKAEGDHLFGTNASNITAGVLPPERLPVSSATLQGNPGASTTLPFLMSTNTYTGQNTFNGLVRVSSTVHSNFQIWESSNLVVPDNGAGGVSTLNSLNPTSSLIIATCLDGNGCTMALTEAGARQGQFLTLVGTGTIDNILSDSSGVVELSSGTTSVSYKNMTTSQFIYIGDRWVEINRATP